MAELKPAYLIHGDDDAKLDSWRHRLRARARDEGPSTSLEMLAGDALTIDAFVEAIGALTLSVGRRYVLADGVERWKDKEVKQAAEAMKALPPDTVVLLIATGKVTRRRGEASRGPAPEALGKAVKSIGGEVQLCEAPTPSKYPAWTVRQGAELGLVISDDAAQALVERVGTDEHRTVRQRRLMRELEKLAIYAPDEGRVDRETVEAATMSDVEARAYELADAVIDGDRERALLLGEDLRDRGAEIMHIVFAMLRQLRQARRAAAMLDAGASKQEIASALRVPPFIANQIAARAGRADAAALERTLEALAELDYTVRGGANRDAGTALTLALAETKTPC
jgi:DNA polymerase-3 subunit delta